MSSSSSLIPLWPASAEIVLEMRPLLEPRFVELGCGISEFTFANIYLFRHVHHYRVADFGGDVWMITGRDGEDTFFMLPFSLPGRDRMDDLLSEFSYMKNASKAQAATLGSMGFHVQEDKDNFDYLYLREDLAGLEGRKFYRKRNRVRHFLSLFECVYRPITPDRVRDALEVLEAWRESSETEGDYGPAREALERMRELGLEGLVYYIDGRAVAYAMGEQMPGGLFAVHFEKGVPGYPGLLQFVNQSFAASLPEDIKYINREQDLGIEGLRHAKLSYRPDRFVEKFRVCRTDGHGGRVR
jgi:hypothetical protein